MARIDCKVTGVGGYLPANMVTNEELAKRVDTNDGWIRSRTGIAQRHFAADDEATSDIATKAAQQALEMAGIAASDIDAIIIATVTPDRTFPSTAVHVQAKLGAGPGMAFDVSAACGGFVYALNIANALILTGQIKRAMLIGAEKLSCFLDWDDRTTCVLFGDGGGALLIEGVEVPDDAPKTGIIGVHASADGRLTEHLYADGGAVNDGHSWTCADEWP